MKGLKKICHAVDMIYNGIAWLCGIILFLLIALSLASVVARVMSQPIFWADEAQRYLMIYMAFIGAGVLSERGDHLMVDLLELFVPKSIRNYFYYLSDVIVIVAMFCFLNPAIRMVTKNITVRSSALPITMGYVYLCIPVGVVLIMIGTARVLVGKIFFQDAKEEA